MARLIGTEQKGGAVIFSLGCATVDFGTKRSIALPGVVVVILRFQADLDCLDDREVVQGLAQAVDEVCCCLCPPPPPPSRKAPVRLVSASGEAHANRGDRDPRRRAVVGTALGRRQQEAQHQLSQTPRSCPSSAVLWLT